MTHDEALDWIFAQPRTAKLATVMPRGAPHVAPRLGGSRRRPDRAQHRDRHQAAAFGKRNALPGELLVTVTPTKVTGVAGLAD